MVAISHAKDTCLCGAVILYWPLQVQLHIILYFAWEDQSNAVYRIVHMVLINCITVLYESYSTVMQLIGQIQYTLANTVQLCREFIFVNNTL